MRTYTLTIPAPMGLTKSGSRTALWLTANDRRKWRAKAALVRQWRALGRKAATEAAVPPLDRVQVTARVHRARGGRFDPSNWADTAKAVLDGIVDARVLEDDSHEYVTGPDMRAGEPRDTPCLVLTITQL
ncbi:hypothetical protein QP858_08015 [Trueperella bernardiae]|uniref:Uncharacterized protein n=2 Tax=Bacillati TaxID=1783272 RepID=A0AAW6ZKV2_9ACTO|nr:hypothetical protein [Micrococcus luteus]MDK8526499.1 hypothetical protein [Micrococcus luteus]MDK8602399.1 hypothetical protein [Trueperella bernardiae]